MQQHIAADAANAENVEKHLATLDRHTEENYQDALRRKMRDTSLSLKERAEAASTYKKYGYNGTTGAEAEVLIKAYEDQFRKEVIQDAN